MSDTGLFGPGSMTWRVNREGVLLLGGGRALVLQVAHPLGAEQFGVPRDRQPDTFPDFNDYVRDMLAGDRIAVTDALRDVVDATLRPELPLVARPLVAALNLVTVGMLPQRVRRELEVAWTPGRERLLEASRVVISRLLPVLPRI